jgi:hypothetical protein
MVSSRTGRRRRLPVDCFTAVVRVRRTASVSWPGNKGIQGIQVCKGYKGYKGYKDARDARDARDTRIQGIQGGEDAMKQRGAKDSDTSI